MARKRRKKRTQPAPPLEWRESRTARWLDELRAGEQIHATLRWAGWASTQATGSARAGRWTFERPRLLSRNVEVWISGAKDRGPIAVFEPDLFGSGPLSFTDGRVYHWQCENVWRTDWAFTDAADRPVLRAVDTSGFVERRTGMWLSAPALPEEDRALLVLLGRYLMVLQAQDAAAAAVAASVAVL